MPHAAVERACSMDSLLMRAVLDASNDTEKKKKKVKASWKLHRRTLLRNTATVSIWKLFSNKESDYTNKEYTTNSKISQVVAVLQAYICLVMYPIDLDSNFDWEVDYLDLNPVSAL